MPDGIKMVYKNARNFTRASLAELIKVADLRFDDDLQRLDANDSAESGTVGFWVRGLAKEIGAHASSPMIGQGDWTATEGAMGTGGDLALGP